MFEQERSDLVNVLREKGITDLNVLEAVSKVERHLFVPPAIQHLAYNDNALPIGFGQTISQPYTVAFMTQALNLNSGAKILEIGTGSGYQAAVLYQMGMKVFSIERNMEIHNRTLKLFDKLEIRVATRCSDGTIGWSQFAPYDGIIVTAGGPTIPEYLKKQLAVGGRMVVPVGDKKAQVMKILTKTGENDFDVKEAPNFAFVPLIGKDGWKNA